MEVHRQTCQACDSRKLRNILLREPGENDRVLVECTECKEPVAQYVIAPGGYYHHAKGFESYLRGLTRDGDFMGGKIMENDYMEIQEKYLQAMERAKKYLKDRDKDD